MKYILKNKRIFLVALILILLSGCASNKGSAPRDNYPSEMEYSDTTDRGVAENKSDGAEGITTEDGVAIKDLKIITTFNYSIISTNIEESISRIKDFVNQSGGYVANEERRYGNEYSGDGYNALLRIPKDKSSGLSALFQTDKDLFKLNTQSKSTEEVSKEYFDQEVRLGVLENKLTRLKEISNNQGEVEKLLEVEKEISNTILEIENIKGSLRYLDDKVAMDTVNLYITEKAITSSISQTGKKDPFLSRVSDAFIATWIGFVSFIESLVLTLITLLPYILLIALLIFLFRKFRKNKTCPFISLGERIRGIFRKKTKDKKDL